WQSCYVLSAIGDPGAIPALKHSLTKDTSTVVRGVAACALGAFPQPEAVEALRAAAESEKSPDVLTWVKQANEGKFRQETHVAMPLVKDYAAKAVLAGTHYSLVLVKDFLRVENSGGKLTDVEFERYTPVIDDEQFVVARWFDGATDDGAVLPVSVVTV